MDDSSKKHKILHSSFACDPHMGSEPYVGWNWAKMLADGFDLHVLTRKHHYNAIANTTLSKKIVFHFFDIPGFSTMDHRSKFMKFYYVIWQFLVLFKAIRLHSTHKYSLVHHITYNNIDVPGFLWSLPGAKFVWGPIGGCQVPPPSLKRVYDKFWKKERLRKSIKQFARINPIVRYALKKASLILFANADTRRLLHGIDIAHSIETLETAIDFKKTDGFKAIKPPPNKLKLLWVGRIEHRKALVIALDAIHFGRQKHGDNFEISLDIIGTGPLQDNMKEYAASLHIEDFVTFHGEIPFESMTHYFIHSDLLLFTSVQDTSGNVILEAMCAGMPVIALNHQGPAEILKNGGGVLIDIKDYHSTVESFAESVFNLSKKPNTYTSLSKSAVASIQKHHTWKSKSILIAGAYNEILNPTKNL